MIILLLLATLAVAGFVAFQLIIKKQAATLSDFQARCLLALLGVYIVTTTFTLYKRFVAGEGNDFLERKIFSWFD